MSAPQDVLAFWLDEIGPKGWYAGGDALDATIRDRFSDLWDRANAGALSMWLTYPSGCLAYIVLTDQFPRNIFRGQAKAFSTDRAALSVAKAAVGKNWDLKIDEPARQFFYLPMMHSECITDQERSVRLILTRMPDHGASNLLHARAHRDVIRRFGRFPFRNVVLSRRDTELEAEFIKNGGYGATVEALRV